MSWTFLRFWTLAACLCSVAGSGVTLYDQGTSYLLYHTSGATLRSLNLRFRTRVSDCLLVYQDSSKTTSDYALVRLVGARLELNVNIGTKPVIISPDIALNDDAWHTIRLSMNASVASLTLDSEEHTGTSPSLSSLRLTSSVYIGGMPSPSHSTYSLPTVSTLPRFIGCLDGIVVVGMSLKPLVSPGTRDGCVDVCASSPCRNGGVCSNFYSHFTCDCLLTGFGGSQCEQISDPVSFQGVQYILYDAQYNPLPTQPIDLQLLLKTTWSSGLILMAQSSQSSYVSLVLKEGNLVFSYVINDAVIATLRSTNVSDNIMHRVQVSRIGATLKLSLDDVIISTGTISSTTRLLVVDRAVYIGGALSLLLNTMSSSHGFIGCLQQVTLNGIDMTSLASLGSASISIIGHLDFWCPYEHIVSVNIPDEDSSLVVSDWHSGTLSLTLDFRTLQCHSVLLYSATRYQTEWFEMRISNSHIQVTFHGKSNSAEVLIVPTPINDGRWHCLYISYDTSHLEVRVDNITQSKDSSVAGNVLSALRSSPLFIGSQQAVSSAAVPASQHSGFPGYRGCVRKVKIGSRDVDVFGLIERSAVTGNVFVGDCEYGDSCRVSPCRNHGVCLRRYDGFECNCTATQHTGTLCQQALPSDTVWLRKRSSSLHSSLPSTTADSVSATFEFRTTTAEGQIISFASSLRSTPYIALMTLSHEVVSLMFAENGRVFQLFLEVPSRVTDGEWHFIQISVDSEKMGLSVDSHTQIKCFPPEVQVTSPLVVFVGQSTARRHEQPTRSVTGCFRDLTFGSHVVNLQAAVSSSNDDIRSGCAGACSSRPCLHGGMCVEGWGSFRCDCSDTQYTGQLCEAARPSVMLQTDSAVTVDFPSLYTPTTFNDRLKFSFLASSQLSSGTLLFISNTLTSQYILIQAFPSYFIAILQLQHGGGVLSLPGNFTDGSEYTVDIKRQGAADVMVEINGIYSQSKSLSGGYSSFQSQSRIVIGGIKSTVLTSHVTASDTFQGCIWGIEYNGLKPLQWLSPDASPSLQYDGFALRLSNIGINTCGSMPLPTTPPPVTSQTPSDVTTNTQSPFTSPVVAPQAGTSKMSLMGVVIGAAVGGTVVIVIVGLIAYKCIRKQTVGSYNVDENRTVAFRNRRDSDLPDITPYDIEGRYADPQPNNQVTINGGSHHSHKQRIRPQNSKRSRQPNGDRPRPENNNSSSHVVALSPRRRRDATGQQQQEWFL